MTELRETSDPAAPAPVLRLGLAAILIGLGLNLALGAGIKSPCIGQAWTGQQYTRLCYTDIVPLFGTEHLEGGRLPYLDACPSEPCDEYPVLAMYAMRAAAAASATPDAFFATNAVLLTIAAGITAVLLYLLAGPRAAYFAFAPTLAIYATTNWDLYAVALATSATYLFLRRRDVWAGIMLGLGTAMKLYPLLLVAPFVADRFRRTPDGARDPDGGIHLAWATAGSWLVANLPFALLAFGGWSFFYRFNSQRAPDWDSLWFIGCHHITGELSCPPAFTKTVNIGVALGLVTIVTVVWRVKARREPAFSRWHLGFPILVAFLLTTKVYSPQYGLWLLPWFALSLPDVRLFLAFELADIGVFVTRFSFFGRFTGVGGVPFWWFEVAVLSRAVVLVACLVAWVVLPTPAVPRMAPSRQRGVVAVSPEEAAA